MTKTKEELNKLKEEYETLTAKLKELTEDELKAVIGGTQNENTQTNSIIRYYCPNCNRLLGSRITYNSEGLTRCPNCGMVRPVINNI